MRNLNRQIGNSSVRRIVLAVLLSLLVCLTPAARADIVLDAWRESLSTLRIKADNDAPAAYHEARQLQAAMPDQATAADKARMLNMLSRIELHLAMIPESVRHSVEARAIAKQANDVDGRVEAILNFTLGAINRANFDEMIEATHDGMALLDKVHREELRAEMMFQASMLYLRFGQVEELVTMAMQGLEAAKGSSDPRVNFYAEQSMATAFMQSKRHAEARVHYRNMLEAARKMHSSLMEASALLGMASVVDGMGDRAEAIRLIEQGTALFQRIGAPFYVGHARHQLADIYRVNRQPGKALPLVDANVKLYAEHDNPIGLWWTLQLRSHIHQALGRLGAARQDATSAYALAGKSGFNIYLSGSAQRLSEVIAAQGDHKEAYRWAAEAMALKEKADREKTGNRIVQLAQRFREESKQREIDELSRHNERQHAQQQRLFIVLISVLALLGVTVYFLFRLRRSRAEIRALNAGLEQRVMTRTAELYESRQSLAEAQRIAKVGSWELDHVANVLTWSEESYRIFEIDPQHFGATYEDFLQAVHPEDREKVDRAFMESVGKQERYEIEHRLLLSDGRVKYVHEHCETTYDDNGYPLHSIGAVQDITERKEIENALQESRELLTEAQRIAKVGSWEYDIASDTHTWSDELFRIYEIDPETEGASYEGCEEATHPDDRERIAKLYLNAVETGQPYESEHRLRMKDGRIKHVHERCEMVFGPDGTLLRAVGMMQDITERKQVEQQLKEALELSEGIINAIPDILFEIDREGRYLNVWTQNPELLAAQKEMLLGRTFHEVLSPENAEASMEAIRDADANGLVQGRDICIDLPQGKRWFAHTLSKKVSGLTGKVTFLALSRDITDRKLLEAELRDSRNFLDSVIDAVPDPIFVKDRQHNWILLNEAFCRFAALSHEALIGKSDYDIFPREEADVYWEKDELVFASGEVNLNEEGFTSADGEKRFIQTKKTPFVSADGRQMLVGVIHDITDRKQYEAAREAALADVQRLADLRSEFIAHMSHELRTPLNSILGYAQMLGRDGRMDEKQHASVDMIRQSGEHLLSLIEDILDLARIEAGKLELEPSDIPLARFLNVVTGIVNVRAQQKRLDFVCEFSPDLPQGIRGDEKRLRQVLLNLLSNAIKFTDRGKVVLRVERVQPSRLSFSVTDTGIGLSAAEREQIFRSFEQVGDIRHRVGGSGLGLAISRQLVRLMGGDITVESHPGHGSTFSFELELPETEIKAGMPLALPAVEARTDTVGMAKAAAAFTLPPQEEMRALHRLALLGNMRDIARQATHIRGLDPRYRAFADHLLQLAEGFQSKAILALIERSLS